MLLVDRHGHAFAIIEDRDAPLRLVDFHANLTHRGIALLVVSSVDQDLVECLVQAWHISQLALLHSSLLRIEDPHVLEYAGAASASGTSAPPSPCA
eukprot:6187237-Pleurochrysis_carterae.AAC.1